jgi:hypothetical protein
LAFASPTRSGELIWFFLFFLILSSIEFPELPQYVQL